MADAVDAESGQPIEAHISVDAHADAQIDSHAQEFVPAAANYDEPDTETFRAEAVALAPSAEDEAPADNKGDDAIDNGVEQGAGDTTDDGWVVRGVDNEAHGAASTAATATGQSDVDRQRDSSAAGVMGDTVHDDGKMFIGGLNWETTQEGLSRYFSTYGTVVEAVIMKDPHTGRSRFSEPASVDKVIAAKPHTLDHRMIEPKRAVPRTPAPTASGSGERTKKIFVGGISQQTTEDGLKSYFGRFGEVSEAVLMLDRDTRRPRGFGFVTFVSDDAADRVCETSFHEVDGKSVEVKKAQPLGVAPRPAARYGAGGHRDQDPRDSRDSHRDGYGGHGRDYGRDAYGRGGPYSRDSRDSRDSRNDYRDYRDRDSRGPGFRDQRNDGGYGAGGYGAGGYGGAYGGAAGGAGYGAPAPVYGAPASAYGGSAYSAPPAAAPYQGGAYGAPAAYGGGGYPAYGGARQQPAPAAGRSGGAYDPTEDAGRYGAYSASYNPAAAAAAASTYGYYGAGAGAYGAAAAQPAAAAAAYGAGYGDYGRAAGQVSATGAYGAPDATQAPANPYYAATVAPAVAAPAGGYGSAYGAPAARGGYEPEAAGARSGTAYHPYSYGR